MNSSEILPIRQRHMYWKWLPSYRDSYNAVLNADSHKQDWAPLIAIPLLAAVMLVSSVFLLIVFRQNPTLVITTVAGCLIVITVYLIFTTVADVKETYE